jgi:hypothetical protein
MTCIRITAARGFDETVVERRAPMGRRFEIGIEWKKMNERNATERRRTIGRPL